MNRIRVAGAALNTTPLDWAGNLALAREAIGQAKAQGVAVLCLPELCLSGYGCEDAFFRPDVLQRAWQSLHALLPDTHGLCVTVGLPVAWEQSLYNTVAVLHEGQLLGLVAKQTLPGDGVYYEPRWFKPWPDGEQTTWHAPDGTAVPFGDWIFDLGGIRLGLEICEDAWSGARPGQRHYAHNVDLILNPSASHFAFGKSATRRNLVTEASRAYACTYVYSNLVGCESGRILYDGEVLIAQQGRLLARNTRFSYHNVQLVTAVVDLEPQRLTRRRLFSFHPDGLGAHQRLLDSPTGLRSADAPATPPLDLSLPDQDLPKHQEFYQAVTLGLWDYLRKSRSRGFVISLSGGADSCACAVLCAHSLTRARAELGDAAFFDQLSYWPLRRGEPLIAQSLALVYQATENSGPETEQSARELALALGAVWQRWDIQPLLDQYEALGAHFAGRDLAWHTDDLALQNIQARVRAPGIWLVANLRGALLVTTSNRSEAAVGYATMDGDTSGGIAPLGGIDKATLREWLRWAETELHLPALRYVNQLQPTAELRPPAAGQTDEGDLMPYAVLDRIERQAIHLSRSPRETWEVLRGVWPEVSDRQLGLWVIRFFRLWSQNQWKRERYAPSFHLDDANLDPRTWCRFPILSGGFAAEIAELEALLAS